VRGGEGGKMMCRITERIDRKESQSAKKKRGKGRNILKRE
jgi:hypothetical protein